MGAVYTGFDLEAREFVAIKTLFGDLQGDEIAVGLFEREGEISSLLDHPNVVRYFRRGKQEEIQYLGLEYVRGTTVDGMLEGKQPLNAAQVVEIMEDCAQALRHVHSKDIIHRDLKPENIIINQDGVLKLIDFGIGIIDFEDPFAAEGMVVGTCTYASPEQNQGHDVGFYSDLYSLGALAWHSLVGRRWATGTTPFQVTMAQLSGSPEPPSQLVGGVPPALDQIILKLMEREPEDRFESAEDLLGALSELRKEEERKGGTENLFADSIASKWAVAKRSFYEKRYALSKSLAKYIADRRPDFAPVHFLLGKLFALEEREFNSTDSFQKAMRLDPQNLEYPADFALSLYRMNMFSLAKQELENLVQRAPDHPLAKGFLELVEEKLAADRAADPRLLLQQAAEEDEDEIPEPGLEDPLVTDPNPPPVQTLQEREVHQDAVPPAEVSRYSLYFPGLGRLMMGDQGNAARVLLTMTFLLGLAYACLYYPEAPSQGWNSFYRQWVHDNLRKMLDLKRRSEINAWGDNLATLVWSLRLLAALLVSAVIAWFWRKEHREATREARVRAHRGEVTAILEGDSVETTLGSERGLEPGDEVEIYRLIQGGRTEFFLGRIRLEEVTRGVSTGVFLAAVGVTESAQAGDRLRAVSED